MMEIPLDLVGAITGIVGTITGVISLIWLISKNKSKLKLERAYFHHHVKSSDGRHIQDFVKIQIVLRNLGHRSTTIDNLWIIYGSHQIPEQFQETTIPASSSKTLNYELCFEKGDLKRFSDEGIIQIGLNIIHTFGSIRRKSKIHFEEEYYNF